MDRADELKVIKRRIPRIDPAFAPAIRDLAPCTLGVDKPRRTQYQSLVRAVIAQQVSRAAARTITGRLQERCAGSITPARVGALSSEQLRSVGLTSAKVRTISELTQASRSGEIDFRTFTNRSDEEIVRALTPLFGIGRWTVEMFLIFHLGRLDVWPIDDLAVRRGWDRLHGNTAAITASALRPLGDPFAGMRSVVAWYCWRAS